ncbi:MAG: hypothetical protein IKA82_00205 [Clostridia bacterium]|nr:hypothetical protein [Clostridia bacterium]
MYDNISEKLKALAKAVFLIGVIVSVTVGLFMISSDNEDLIPVGLLEMLLGSVASWVSSWFIYGFGELIEKVTNIERSKCGGSPKVESVSEHKQSVDIVLDGEWCGERNDELGTVDCLSFKGNTVRCSAVSIDTNEVEQVWERRFYIEGDIIITYLGDTEEALFKLISEKDGVVIIDEFGQRFSRAK